MAAPRRLDKWPEHALGKEINKQTLHSKQLQLTCVWAQTSCSGCWRDAVLWAVWSPSRGPEGPPQAAPHFEGADVPGLLTGPKATGTVGAGGPCFRGPTFLLVGQELGGVHRGTGQAAPRAPGNDANPLVAVHPLVLVLRPADELRTEGRTQLLSPLRV